MSRIIFIVILVSCWRILFCQDVLRMADWEKDSILNGGIFSYCVKDADSGEMLAEYQSEKYLIPASTLKVVSSYAALKILGGSFRFQTTLGTDGKFTSDSTALSGNLIIEGEGDPTLQSRFFYSDDSLLTDAWAELLVKKGLRAIQGKIIVRMKKFPVVVPDCWLWSDLSNAYGAFISPVNYRDNTLRYVFQTGNAGEKAIIQGVIPSHLNSLMHISNYVISRGTEDQAQVWGSPFEYKKRILGSLPVHQKEFILKGSMPEPWMALFTDLKNSLQKKGIILGDTIPYFIFYENTDTLYQTRKILHRHFSPSLERIIYYLLTYSHNLYAESLILTLGRGNLDAGIDKVMKFLNEKKISRSRIYMVDGSGLSRNNLVSTRFLTDLLCYVAKDKKNYSVIYNSLPVAGKNGTLLKVGKGTPLEGNLRAKTGYIHKVRSFAGYLKTRRGKQIAFALMVNNYDVGLMQMQKKMMDFILDMYEKF